MNPLLSKLQPYPFERLRQLLQSVTPSPAHSPISLGIGEPKHPTPQFIKDALCEHLQGLASYPATSGEPALRRAITRWLERRYGLALDPDQHVLPVNGSREALFAFTQVVINTAQRGPQGEAPIVVCPNPFYQIYEGAALLAGAQPYYVNCDPARNFAVDWDSVPPAIWQRTQLLFVCSPNNPTGSVMQLGEWEKLLNLSAQYGFVIASDECYSEIYLGDEPPLGGLEAAARLGRPDFKHLVTFTSLSKRSNVPGMRSGFVAGDPAWIKPFLLYRTYHGSAMSPTLQAASRVAWEDETHVIANREQYRLKFSAVLPLLSPVMPVQRPDAGFYLWACVPQQVCGGSDTEFAKQLLAHCNVTVLPGSYLARTDSHNVNPGTGRVRMALVAELNECLEAARRIVQFIQTSP